MKTAFRKHLELYFNFSRAERNAVLFLSVLIIILILYPFISASILRKPINEAELKKRLAALEKQDSAVPGKTYREQGAYMPAGALPSESFAFDPNTVSVTDLRRLGFKPWIAERIDKYRRSGAVFHKTADLKKVYGIDTVLVNKLSGYMSFPSPASKVGKNPSGNETARTSEMITLLNLNTADTAALMRLPGIGAGFARRIIKYREKLGGFYDKSQLKEVYGLPPETYALIEAKIYTGPEIRKININTVSLQELRHPYLTYNQAKVLIAYRQQHGAFNSREDLLKTGIIGPDVTDRLILYLSF